MPSEDVIELSVEETNKLRAELGLAPLRIKGSSSNNQDASTTTTTTTSHNSTPATETSATGGEAVLELSVDETNELRRKLGLKPLRASETEDDGKSKLNAFHKPAENKGEIQEAANRIERAKLEREVQRGIAERFQVDNLGAADEESSNALSWAAKMRAATTKKQHTNNTKKTTKTGDDDGKFKKSEKKSYSERELEGMNVSHDLSEIEAGSTTVLTLADAPLLKKKDETSRILVGLNDGPETLENVLLTESRMQQDGLREKRKLELGMGRAGGYAGFDDDEFEELGGTQASSRFGSGGGANKATSSAETAQRRRGFQIGSSLEDEEEKKSNDLFAGLEGKAVSLEPATADVTASDFMTAEEEEALKASEKKKKKDTKFKKKKKKEKHNHKRKADVEDEAEGPSSKSLLEELEDTAVVKPSKGVKRRRAESDDELVVGKDATKSSVETSTPTLAGDGNEQEQKERRAKYDEIMAKGNQRTEAAFRPKETKPAEGVDVDEEPDDAFLNAALAKARRLQRLREMSSNSSSINKTSLERGVDAVVKAVHNAQQLDLANSSSNAKKGGTITFAADDTREFTRALRVRAEQAERHRKDVPSAAAASNVELTNSNAEVADVTMSDAATTQEMDTTDISELAKEVKEEKVETAGFDGSTASVGRGLSSVISMLQQTGEITGKRSGREELRGRAKDKRHYEDYEPLDLNSVVRIDERFATDKDKEMASREIKLEYRDKHGRLLTRKEAYRDLCYQFHGHGSSKKREDKRMKQIVMEQSEARVASRQVAIEKGSGTTLGALKATQEATGKAFVVHKT